MEGWILGWKMKSLSSVGLGLSVVFGCLLLALIAELYYLLWWKKRISSRDFESDLSNPAREFFYLFCWKKPSSLSHTALNPQEVSLVQEHQGQNQNINKDFWLKPFGQDDDMEAELMRLHNLSGPPRFLFTIVEETKEDLESEDGKSRGDNKSRKGSRSRSLSDLLETPYLTPLASPTLFTPPLTPMNTSHGFNPLFESSTDAEFNKIRSSPPPKFKFLKDAEEKLQKKILIEETDKMSHTTDGVVQENGTKSPPQPHTPMLAKDHEDHEDDGPFITITIDRHKERELHNQHCQLTQQNHSTSSQVLPLAYSPSTFRSSSPANKSFISPS